MNLFWREIAVALILLALIIYLLWRRISRSRAERQIAKSLPPSNALAWQIHDTERAFIESAPVSILSETFVGSFASGTATPLPSNQRRKANACEQLLPGALDGAIGAIATVHSFESIDPAVLHALTASTADHISGLGSISHYIDVHFFSASESTAHGFFERLTGYVTEQKAATALEAMGHHVQFAATANQPVWDLLVDGHSVQIKEGLTGVKEFLAQHHDMPIFTGFDNADSLHDPMVHGLHGLSSDAIHHATQQSLDGIHDTLHGSFHFPVITFCISTFREASLLSKQHTTVQKAMFHVALDTVGVGTGMLLGAKAGALAGSMMPGPGTLFGAGIGSIVGGIGGKFLSNEIRFGAFKEARAAYEQSVASWDVIVESGYHTTESQIKTLSKRYQQHFELARQGIWRTARQDSEFHSGTYEQAYAMTIRSLPTVFDEIEDRLANDFKRVFADGRNDSLWQRVFPSFRNHFRRQASLWFSNKFDVIRKEKAKFMLSLRRDDTAAVKIWSQFANTYHFASLRLERLFGDLESEHDRINNQLREVRTHAEASIVEVNRQMRKASAKEIEDMSIRLAEQLSPANARVKDARTKLIKEGKAVGVLIPEDVNPSPEASNQSADNSPQIFWGDLSSLDTQGLKGA